MKIQRQRGFTLIEVIVVMVIAIILLAWGVPGYRDLKLRQDTTSYANEMLYTFTLARAEAVRRGVSTSIVRVGGDWEDGWQVINLADGSILAQQDALADGFQLNIFSGGGADMIFDNTGALSTPQVVYELKHDDLDNVSKRIQVSASGSTRVTTL